MPPIVNSYICYSLCDLRSALHLPPDSDHRQQLQQVLRKGQNRGGDRSQKKEGILGGGEKGYIRQIEEKMNRNLKSKFHIRFQIFWTPGESHASRVSRFIKGYIT